MISDNKLFINTIAAIATPVGRGGIGIVRISGPQALDVMKKIFIPANKDEKFVSHHAYYGSIRSDGKILDRAIGIYMQAPHSYTGEDVVELQCHGGEKLIAAVLKLVLENGAMLASPGEFTMRAFINGKIDLTQAEAVADIIDAKTNDALMLSQAQLGGAQAKKFAEIEQLLLDLTAFIEVGIDFPDDEDALDSKDACQKLQYIIEEIEIMLAGASMGRIYREGLRCVLLGEVNAGKSSLFNALLRQDRAIVTDIPGTTRDSIEEYIDINGIPVLLIDTAGIRQTTETVEALGIERSKKYADSAQLLLLLIDGTKAISEESCSLINDYKAAKPIYIITKNDSAAFISDIEKCVRQQDNETDNICIISAQSGYGIEQLKTKIKELSVGTDKPREGLINNLRHEEAARKALAILKEAYENASIGMDIDLLGIDLMNAYQKLGEITGHTAGEEVINNIFAKFCLGK